MSLRLVHIPGFHPLNWHYWHRHTGTRPWTRAEYAGIPLRWWRLTMLWGHRRFLR